MRLASLALCLALTACAAAHQAPMSGGRELPTTTLRLCNDTNTSLRVNPNWKAIFPIGAGRCTETRVPIGMALLTVQPVVAPAGTVGMPAARLEVPAAGATARYDFVGGFITLAKVEGASPWSRCGWSKGIGTRPPPSLINTLWRDDLERWMRHYLVCDPAR